MFLFLVNRWLPAHSALLRALSRKIESLFTLPLIQMGARVYLPTLGRFLHTDRCGSRRCLAEVFRLVDEVVYSVIERRLVAERTFEICYQRIEAGYRRSRLTLRVF